MRAVEKLDAALQLHMEVEEKFVYPVVERVIGDEEAEEANIEHGLARDGLAELTKLVDEPGFGAAVAMLTAGIKHHVKEEERELFPELKRKLDRASLAELGDEVKAAKSPRRARRLTRPVQDSSARGNESARPVRSSTRWACDGTLRSAKVASRFARGPR